MSTNVRMGFGLAMVMIVSLVLAPGQTPGTRSRNPLDRLESRKAGLRNSKPTDVHDAFIEALHVSGTPGGALIVDRCGERKKEVVIPESATLEEALNIITGDQEYHWIANDRSVNLLPKFFALSPLDVKISRFEMKDVLVSEAYRRLYELPEVRAALSARNLREPTGWQFIAGGVNFERKRISLDLKDVTLREALNAIVEADGEKIWLFKVRSCEGHYEFITNLIN